MNDFLSHVAKDARDTFFNAEFSVGFSISDGAVNTKSIKGIVDMTSVNVDAETGAEVLSANPTIAIWLPDVPWHIRQGHKVTLRGKEYVIRECDQLGDQDIEQVVDGSAILHLELDK